MNIADAANVARLLSIINGVSYARLPLRAGLGHAQAHAHQQRAGRGRVLLLHWLSGNTLNGLRMLLGLVIVLCAMLLLMQKKALERPSALSPCGWPACPRGCSVACLPRPARPWSITSTASRWIACWCATACLPCLSPALAARCHGGGGGQLNWAVMGWTALAFPVVTGVTWWRPGIRPPGPEGWWNGWSAAC
jgi:hypothetical protein